MVRNQSPACVEKAAKEGVGHWFDDRTLAQRLLLKKGKCQTWGAESEGPIQELFPPVFSETGALSQGEGTRSQRDRLDLETACVVLGQW